MLKSVKCAPSRRIQLRRLTVFNLFGSEKKKASQDGSMLFYLNIISVPPIETITAKCEFRLKPNEHQIVHWCKQEMKFSASRYAKEIDSCLIITFQTNKCKWCINPLSMLCFVTYIWAFGTETKQWRFVQFNQPNDFCFVCTHFESAQTVVQFLFSNESVVLSAFFSLVLLSSMLGILLEQLKHQKTRRANILC